MELNRQWVCRCTTSARPAIITVSSGPQCRQSTHALVYLARIAGGTGHLVPQWTSIPTSERLAGYHQTVSGYRVLCVTNRDKKINNDCIINSSTNLGKR